MPRRGDEPEGPGIIGNIGSPLPPIDDAEQSSDLRAQVMADLEKWAIQAMQASRGARRLLAVMESGNSPDLARMMLHQTATHMDRLRADLLEKAERIRWMLSQPETE